MRELSKVQPSAVLYAINRIEKETKSRPWKIVFFNEGYGFNTNFVQNSTKLQPRNWQVLGTEFT